MRQLRHDGSRRPVALWDLALRPGERLVDLPPGHWFDNWHLRELLEEAAAQRGLTEEELLIIDPERFQNGKDGPCHPPTFRKRFWTDVLRLLELSFDLLPTRRGPVIRSGSGSCPMSTSATWRRRSPCFARL